jgi:SRSO17 transposase
LPADAWRDVAWRQGVNKKLRSRFAALRVRPAHRDYWRAEPHAEEWLLIEWPKGESEPTKYWLSTLPADVALSELASAPGQAPLDHRTRLSGTQARTGARAL